MKINNKLISELKTKTSINLVLDFVNHSNDEVYSITELSRLLNLEYSYIKDTLCKLYKNDKIGKVKYGNSPIYGSFDAIKLLKLKLEE